MQTSAEQCIRLLDVFVLGPFLLMAAKQEKSPYFKMGLAVAGMATILYSGNQYWTHSRERAQVPVIKYQ